MIGVSVKARRLGYLKVLSIFSVQNLNWNIRTFNKRFEDFALTFDWHIKEIKEQSGIILPNNGKSAKPYVELAESLEFLCRKNKEYLVGTEFSEYAMNSVSSNRNENPFKLCDMDCDFFLDRLLSYDTEPIAAFLKTIHHQGPNDIINLRRSYILRLKESANENKSEKLKLAVSKTETSNLYSEELFHPRLHWLLDLKLLNRSSQQNVVSLTEKGLVVCDKLGISY